MKILNVNMSIDPVTGGGTAERTIQMSKFLVKAGIEYTILTMDMGLTSGQQKNLNGINIIKLPCLNKRFYLPKPSLSLMKIIMKHVRVADLVHIMGHWTVINALVYFAARWLGKPYVVCPAGALPQFGRSKWLKSLYDFIVGRQIIRNAEAWIAVTPAEFPHFESCGIPASRVTVIPNGVCEEDFPPCDTKAFRLSKDLPDNPAILFMGRLNPIKGPDLLLRAFALAHHLIPDYHLVFAGPDDGMQSALIDIANREGIIDRVHFLGFVGGNEKSAAYRMASVLVVPSRQEAMSIVALEAGICGTLVLLTDQCGFDEIKTIDPGLEVPATAEGIADGLVHLLTKPGLRVELSLTLKDFVSQKYTWSAIGEKYLHLYRGLLSVTGIKQI